MTTDRIRAANRRNALLSTGPITDRGRAAVRSNALTHGFYSLTCIGAESPEEFAAIQADFLADFEPAGAAETELVHRLVNDLWKARRLNSVESSLLDWGLQGNLEEAEEVSEDPQEADIIALRLDFYEELRRTNAAPIERLSILADRLYRRIDKAISLLRHLQADRLQSERARAAQSEAATIPADANPTAPDSPAEAATIPAAGNPTAPPAPAAPKPRHKTKPAGNVTPPTPSTDKPNSTIGFVPHNPASAVPTPPEAPEKAA
jgi:hypothetical protein